MLLCSSSSAARHRFGRQPIHWAARNGHVDVLRFVVVACGVPVDARTEDGTTALHLAAWRGHVEACRWLVEDAAADVHATNGFGCNAIQVGDRTTESERQGETEGQSGRKTETCNAQRVGRADAHD